ncbi:hypothetical protein SAMD00079811_83380 (plasmid) [Scytonema sp. HK-05]|nr:hypothetical protein SAMD00079811_83380 [Scytonema sp. HK-05]
MSFPQFGSWYFINPSILETATINPFISACKFQGMVAIVLPLLAFLLEVFRVNNNPPGFGIFDHFRAPGFLFLESEPFTVNPSCGEQDMCMRVMRIFSLEVMQTYICNHALNNELFLHISLDQFLLLLVVQFAGKGDNDFSTELGIFSFLRLLHFVPKFLPVIDPIGGVGWCHNAFGIDAVMLVGFTKPSGLAVIMVIEFFGRAVSSIANSGVAVASSKNATVVIVQCHCQSTASWAGEMQEGVCLAPSLAASCWEQRSCGQHIETRLLSVVPLVRSKPTIAQCWQHRMVERTE